jgi:hypothetical protein
MSGTPSEVFRHVDRLEEVGLRAPQTAEVVARVFPNEKLVPLTVSEALDLLIPAVEKRFQAGKSQ